MHAFSILAWAIFVAGYITARWDLVTRVCELWTFAWEYGVVVRLGCLAPPPPTPPCLLPRLTSARLQARAAKAFACLTFFFVLILIPVGLLTSAEAKLVCYVQSLDRPHGAC